VQTFRGERRSSDLFAGAEREVETAEPGRRGDVFTTLLAAFVTLLDRYTEQEDLVGMVVPHSSPMTATHWASWLLIYAESPDGRRWSGRQLDLRSYDGR
jgi:hypothetical protein